MVEAVNVETMQSNNGSIVEISIILIIYFLIYRIYISVKINICKAIIFSIARKNILNPLIPFILNYNLNTWITMY